jgi:hypothetical protein
MCTGTMCTAVTQEADVCPGTDVAPHRPESCQAHWCDSVGLTALARLTAHSPCAAWPSAAPEQMA